MRGRMEEYHKIGARFAKWRAVIAIGPHLPSSYCIEVNAHALARYAALAQEAGLVPIVEPEALMDGDHDISRCYDVTQDALREVYSQLAAQRVMLEGTLLKTNMVLSAKGASNRAGPEEVAEETVDCLMRNVPAAVPGIAFLSGGQGDDEATDNLRAINIRGKELGAPWELSFSYGRALQSTPLNIWAAGRGAILPAQKAFYRRASLTAAARSAA